MIRYGYSLVTICAILHGAYASWSYSGTDAFISDTLKNLPKWFDAAFAPLLIFPLLGVAQIIATGFVLFIQLFLGLLITSLTLAASNRWFPQSTTEIITVPWYVMVLIFAIVGVMFMLGDSLVPGTTTHPIYPSASASLYATFGMFGLSVIVNVLWLRRRAREIQQAISSTVDEAI